MRTTIKTTLLGRVITWPIDRITHFYADSKYTMAVRDDGKELLIGDTIKDLETEFQDLYIRISRGTLVSRSRVISVETGENMSNGLIAVEGVAGKLTCSRGHLPRLRKFIKGRANG